MMRYICILFLIVMNGQLQAQFIPGFTAFMETDMVYNPSVCGNKDYLSSVMGYRYQWTGV